jgi:hypothetical protein
VTDDRLLAIYLNDHLAGSVTGREVCRRARDENRGSELGDFLDTLLREFEEDRATLKRIMDRVGAEESRAKKVMAHAYEKVGRLKLNGRLVGYSPLSRLVELEFLSIGVEGKRLLWIVLGDLADARLAEFDFEALDARARDQRHELEVHRLTAARIAFLRAPL